MIHYILDGHQVVPIEGHDIEAALKWARWFETADRQVAKTVLPDGKRVSTVFLGIDHNFSFQGPPLLFETMVFGAPEVICERWASWDEAEKGHARIVEEQLNA